MVGFYLFVKFGYDERNGRYAEVGFNVDAVADDRCDTEASMPHSHDNGIRLFLDLGP